MSTNRIFTQELDKKGLRNFGLTTGAIFALLFGVFFPWIFDLEFPRWPWVLFAVLSLWALVAPMTLRRIYNGWMRLGLLISQITTPLILGIVFYLLITPIGLLRKLLGWDSMSRSIDSNSPTYRIDSDQRPSNDLENPY